MQMEHRTEEGRCFHLDLGWWLQLRQQRQQVRDQDYGQDCSDRDEPLLWLGPLLSWKVLQDRWEAKDHHLREEEQELPSWKALRREHNHFGWREIQPGEAWHQVHPLHHGLV